MSSPGGDEAAVVTGTTTGDIEDVGHALTIALAEYSNVAAARSNSHQGSGARYAQFLVVFGAGISFLGLIIRDDPQSGDLALASAAAAAVLLIGVATHVRLVHFTLTQDRYQERARLLRAYLGIIEPSLKRELGVHDGAASSPTSSVNSLTHFVSLAGHVSLLNGLAAVAMSALLLQVVEAKPVWSWVLGPVVGIIVVALQQIWQRTQLDPPNVASHALVEDHGSVGAGSDRE